MLPEGVIQADFDDAIGELREALGPDAVIVQDDARNRSYTDAYTPRQLADNAPSAAVAPRDLEQIQRVLAVARKRKIPLWTVSTGRLGRKAHRACRGWMGYQGPLDRKDSRAPQDQQDRQAILIGFATVRTRSTTTVMSASASGQGVNVNPDGRGQHP